MLFLRDWFLLTMVEFLCLLGVGWYFIAHVGLHLSGHNVMPLVYFACGFLALMSLIAAWSESDRREAKKYRQAQLDAQNSSRQAELAQYQAERQANIASNNLENLTIRTHVPSKWRFVDKESNTSWKWENGSFIQE